MDLPSTNVDNKDNPINRIASLLGEDATPDKEETPKLVKKKKQETADTSDESHPQEAENAESLAEEEVESAESSEEENEDVDTLNNLAEELDIGISDMYALNVNLSRGENLPDGGAISLGELKTFYEKNADIDTLRDGIKTREQELQTKTTELSEIPQVSNELLQARAQVLAIQDAYNRTDWQGIRHTNPAEYAALQSDFRTQFEMAKNNENVALQTVETHQAESRVQQQERLFEAHPELRDKAVRAEMELGILDYAAKFGFSSDDVAKIEDSRLMRLLISASKGMEAIATAKAKQEDKTPTSAQSSARKPLPGRKAALKRLTEKARASGQVVDQAAAVAELIRG